jgi:hypothetical protein
MAYIAEFRQEVDFRKDVTPTNYFNLEQNTVKFYSNKVIDFSSFSFIPTDTLTFYTTVFNSYSVYTNF